MTKSDFRAKAMLGIGVLIGFVLAFPFILKALVSLSSCRGVGGACGALAAVIGALMKPAVVVLIGLWLIWIVYRRLRGLGMSAGWSAAALLWLLGSMQLIVGIGNFWGANFALGIIAFPSMVLTVLLLLLVAFLCFAEPSAVHSDRPDNFAAWIIAMIASAHATVLMASSVFLGVLMIPFAGRFLASLASPVMSVLHPITKVASLGLPLRMVGVLGWIDVAVFAAALAYLIFQQRGDNSAPMPAAQGGGLPPRRSAPSNRSAGVASIAPRKAFGTRQA